MQHRKVEMANIKRLRDEEDRVRYFNTYLTRIPEKKENVTELYPERY